MSDGVALLTWEHDAFGLADSFDDEAKRYRGLRGGQVVSLSDSAIREPETGPMASLHPPPA